MLIKIIFLGVIVAFLTVYTIMQLPTHPRIFHTLENGVYEGFQPLDLLSQNTEFSMDQLDGKKIAKGPSQNVTTVQQNQQSDVQKSGTTVRSTASITLRNNV